MRQLAAAAALPNQARRDSQGICFLGKVRFSEFIREHLGTWRGALLEEETGRILGYHDGFWFYTLGQRRGIPLHGGPWCAPPLNVAEGYMYIYTLCVYKLYTCAVRKMQCKWAGARR